MNRSEVFVAGNGPSLKSLQFAHLEGKDWLGMNAAYRYWDKVGVYPTVYCCLDKVVIRHHALEIAKLLRNPTVRKAFLIKDVLEVLPELNEHPKVEFLEDLVSDGREECRIFSTVHSRKKTTGSWAVRYLIYLGYKNISICGVDCNYVEVVKGARRTGKGLELEISEKDDNPNYFFSDYQIKGDRYQVPNPESHFGNMHLQSFEAIAADVESLGLDVSIFNTSKFSQLHRHSVFPFRALSDALSYPELTCVAVPLIGKELGTFCQNLKLWDLPAFMPLKPGSKIAKKIDLHLFLDGNEKDYSIQSVLDAYARTKFVKHCFREIKITCLDIPHSLNVYERDSKLSTFPRKIGPNLHFLMLINELKGHDKILLMETDCTPGCSNWLERLNSFCVNNEFWVAGSYANSLNNLDPAISLHLNGNAIYAAGDEAYQDFVLNVFSPIVRYMMFELKDVHVAYDCVISKLIAYGTSERLRHKEGGTSDDVLVCGFDKVVENYSKFISCPEIVNYTISDSENDIIKLVGRSDGPAIIHSLPLNKECRNALVKCEENYPFLDADGVLRDCFVNTHILSPRTAEFAFHHFSNNPGINFDWVDYTRGRAALSVQKNQNESDGNSGATIVFSTKQLVPGDYMTISGSLFSENRSRVKLILARHGSGTYIQVSDVFSVDKKAENFNLSIKLKESYSAFRLTLVPDSLIGKLLLTWDLESGVIIDNKGILNPSLESKKIVSDFQRGVDVFYPNERERRCNVIKPKVLIVDSTLKGSQSATGQIKEMLFADWPSNKIAQVYLHKKDPRFKAFDDSPSSCVHAGWGKVLSLVEKFSPDLIYFRPVESVEIFEIFDLVKAATEKPHVVHIMDDWPARLKEQDLELYDELNALLTHAVLTSSANLSICKSMSDEYEKRYCTEFTPISNAIDADALPCKSWELRSEVDEHHPFTVRYMGGLARDMCSDSVFDFAEAVDNISKKIPVVFEIYTMPWYLEFARKATEDLSSVVVKEFVDKSFYPSLLASSDALLIAYNFDELTSKYVGLSFANKVPEIMAAGTAVIAYGPTNIPTIKYLNETGFVQVISERSKERLEKSIERVLLDREHCASSGAALRKLSEREFSAEVVRSRFCDLLFESTKHSMCMAISEEGDPSLSEANKMVRDGRYKEAYQCYLTLYKKTPLRIFLDNAFFCKRKLKCIN